MLRVRHQLPPLRHFYPRARPRAQWEGDQWPQLPPRDSAARQRPQGSLGPRDDGGRARIQLRPKPRGTGLQLK